MDALDPHEAPPIPTYPGRTMADFDALPKGTLAQLVDGTLLISPAPSLRYQQIVTILTRVFGNYIDSTVEVRWSSGPSMRGCVKIRPSNQTCSSSAARYDRISDQGLEGAPDLVVEVLSPSTGYYDLTVKRRVYAESGVLEYWIVDPLEETVEIVVLTEEGYATAGRVKGIGEAAAAVLGKFALDGAHVFRPLQ